jgi:small subunit ribosomal protein S15
MATTIERRQELIKNFGISPKDSGSTEVQVALLTERITEMTKHLKLHAKDNHSRLGLTKMVARRNRLLTYLRAKEVERYKSLIERLGLRK